MHPSESIIITQILKWRNQKWDSQESNGGGHHATRLASLCWVSLIPWHYWMGDWGIWPIKMCHLCPKVLYWNKWIKF